MMRLITSTGLAIAASQVLFSSTLAQETYVSSSSLASTASSASASSSASSTASSQPTPSKEPTVHLIKAGAGGFKFTPQELHNVSVGDIISWEFYPPDHSVARAEFGSACVPYEDTGKDKVGFWSGTQYVNNTDEVCDPKVCGGVWIY